MLKSNTYAISWMKKNGDTVREGPWTDLFSASTRFQQITNNIKPREARFLMNATHPDGTSYEHEIAVWQRA